MQIKRRSTPDEEAYLHCRVVASSALAADITAMLAVTNAAAPKWMNRLIPAFALFIVLARFGRRTADFKSYYRAIGNVHDFPGHFPSTGNPGVRLSEIGKEKARKPMPSSGRSPTPWRQRVFQK
jgi:hypothetical protein